MKSETQSKSQSKNFSDIYPRNNNPFSTKKAGNSGEKIDIKKSRKKPSSSIKPKVFGGFFVFVAVVFLIFKAAAPLKENSVSQQQQAEMQSAFQAAEANIIGQLRVRDFAEEDGDAVSIEGTPIVLTHSWQTVPVPASAPKVVFQGLSEGSKGNGITLEVQDGEGKVFQVVLAQGATLVLSSKR